MAETGTYLDPQAGLLIENYLLNKHKYVGTPYFPKTVEDFASEPFRAVERWRLTPTPAYFWPASAVNSLGLVRPKAAELEPLGSSEFFSGFTKEILS
ncbi:MAG: hypothetical protein DMG05_17505 [Acidobacteria bacterium]|nr:MAG: hypothetical protein DMG05_17505 [Acidobacteriota bacterium]